MSGAMNVKVDAETVTVEMTHEQFYQLACVLVDTRPTVMSNTLDKTYHSFVTAQLFVLHFQQAFKQLTLRKT